MLQKATVLMLALAMLFGLTQNYAFSQEANSANSFNINAKAAILMEPETGKVIVEHNADEQLPPASVTKVMTMLLIYEAIAQGKIKWDDMVTTSEHAANMGGSQIFLEPGEMQTVRDLTKSIVVSSANDASVAMAEFIAGSEEGFVQKMNEKAKELGMKNTNFMNASGLDTEGHVTSARDIAIMSRELITKHPEVFEFTTIWMDTIIHRTARGESEFGLSNTNRLLRTYRGATGLKTGSTSQALFCISATAERDGLQLIAVILGAPDSVTRFGEAKKLLDYGFANYRIEKGYEAGTEKGEVAVNKGQAESVRVVVQEEISVIMPKGNNVALESRVELLDSLDAPVAAGTKAGEVIYTAEGKEVGRSSLVTAENIERISLDRMIVRLLNRWFK
ncbi:MAG: D-alanyl-D-alanine carboxypeptidase [Defluviitaleaceae bacterium]|nr:D-alanyl-D-alanine carboxypeptidase [Defluviitaleaceae bacterium]